jgi:hypothetical protein
MPKKPQPQHQKTPAQKAHDQTECVNAQDLQATAPHQSSNAPSNLRASVQQTKPESAPKTRSSSAVAGPIPEAQEQKPTS